MSRPRIVCLMGPTGVGKSASALALAECFQATIINADSRQVYRAFPLITAQPSLEEQKAYPHRLYGFLETPEGISAGAWGERALQEIAQSRVPLLVGGTGMYIRALFDGIVDIPPIPQALLEEYTEQCRRCGSVALHGTLEKVDPCYAAKIHPNDRQRIVRALCVFEATGKPFSWWHTHTPPPRDVDVLRIGLRMPLDELTPRLAQRVDVMLASGALEEAAGEYAHHADPALPGWSGIGCRELFQYLSGELTLDATRELWIRNTRAYAKRQLTWFNADTRIHWYGPQDVGAIVSLVRDWLSIAS